MKFNDHSQLAGKHAFLGASQHSWLNYNKDHLRQVFVNSMNKERGTRLHDLASRMIKDRIRAASLKKAFNMFVNDAIGFRMESEQVLFYSYNCFGTADAIYFRDGELRIHDLKTGTIPVEKFGQLDIYAALFCLEYEVDPKKIDIVERLYQGRGFIESVPSGEDIAIIMDKIKDFDMELNELESKTY